MKKIKLSQGKVALVDNEDYPNLIKYTWHYLKAPKDSYGYAVSSTPPIRNKKMHRVILNAKKGEIVDHKNHNGIDNRRSNIRIVSINESNHNKRFKNKLGTNNVGRSGKKYFSRITFYGDRVYLGTYETKEKAIEVFKEARYFFYAI